MNHTQKERKSETRKKVNPKCRCNRCGDVLAQRFNIFIAKKNISCTRSEINLMEYVPLQVGFTSVKYGKSKQTETSDKGKTRDC